jgi:PAS domain S-box-containing protein
MKSAASKTHSLQKPELPAIVDLSKAALLEVPAKDCIQEDFRDLFDEAPIPYIHEDLDSRFIRANRAAIDLLGLRPEEVAGTYGKSLLGQAPDNLRRLKEGLEAVSKGKQPDSIELELRRQDNGEPIWVQWWSKPAPSGEYTRTVLIDITERVLMEKAKTALEFTLESGQVGDWDLDLATDTSRRSRRHDQCFGYATGYPGPSWGRKNFLEHTHPEDRLEAERSFVAAIDTRTAWDAEFRVIWPDTTVHWVGARGEAYTTVEGKTTRMRGIVMDITRRKRSEEVLRATQASLEFTLDSGRIGDWDLDLFHDTSRRSLRHDQCFGYSVPIPDANWGVEVFIQHIHPDDRIRVESGLRNAAKKLVDWESEFRVIWPDGTLHWLEARGRIYRTIEGVATRMLGIVMEITERKQNEKALLDAEQSRQTAVLAERNRLARDIHDTLAQGFTGIILQLEAAAEAASRGQQDESLKHCHRAASLARESLSEARRSLNALRPEILENTDLSHALTTLAHQTTVSSDVEAIFSGCGDSTTTQRNEWDDHLLRIAQEFVNNTVRHAHARTLSINLSCAEDKTILELHDDGKGFDATSQYEGFGLLGIRERVDAMIGTLTIVSGEGIGTTMTVILSA